jgi:hypothetical protein
MIDCMTLSKIWKHVFQMKMIMKVVVVQCEDIGLFKNHK